MFKKYLVIATTAAMIGVTSLVGCGGQPAQSTSETTTATKSATTEATDTSTTETKAEASTTTETSATTTDATTNTTTSSEITPEEAKAIALKDAGLLEADVYDLDVERDIDDATPHYDVDFKHGGMEYDYDIAMDGAILTAHSEIDD